MLKTHNQDEWDSFLAIITFYDSSVYQLYRRLFNKYIAQPPLTGPNSLLFSANDKAEVFADTFQDQFSPNFGTALPEVTNIINQISNIRSYNTPRLHNTRYSRANHQAPFELQCTRRRPNNKYSFKKHVENCSSDFNSSSQCQPTNRILPSSLERIHKLEKES